MAKVETPYHALIGKKRVKEICREGGITPKDDLIIDELLLGLHLEGGDYENIRYQVGVSLMRNPRENLIIEVLFLILKEVEAKIIEGWERKEKERKERGEKSK
ncbi:MAG: hypothetical protein COU71_02290 [Parcubacteria group bacterium CG10_big_fil_rev_8_21_14_0_10_38_31]|nr:MAG: hypothetical protein COU71_02290 [Parcubacteria group bacterium CG10_big_fil_rev_8_21_14_0_10_38_31]